MIFLELVPKDMEQLLKDIKDYLANFSAIDGVNIPDIKRVSNRSYNVTSELLKHNIDAIPHIRTRDDEMTVHLNRIEALVESGLDKILLVSGDIHQDAVHQVTPLLLTKELKKRFNELKVYTALDPYRQSFKDEVQYAEEKIEAGSDGFFTQPFFEKELCEKYINQFKNVDIFIGISPVMTQKSYDYWVRVNNVTFPQNFELSQNYNAKLAKELLSVSKRYNKSSYIMPISIEVDDYLNSIFLD